jgi:hypothetical protein
MKEPRRFYHRKRDEFPTSVRFQNPSLYVKDAFHDYIIGTSACVQSKPGGTKMAPVYRLRLGPGQSRIIYLRLVSVIDWDGNPGPIPPFSI